MREIIEKIRRNIFKSAQYDDLLYLRVRDLEVNSPTFNYAPYYEDLYNRLRREAKALGEPDSKAYYRPFDVLGGYKEYQILIPDIEKDKSLLPPGHKFFPPGYLKFDVPLRGYEKYGRFYLANTKADPETTSLIRRMLLYINSDPNMRQIWNRSATNPPGIFWIFPGERPAERERVQSFKDWRAGQYKWDFGVPHGLSGVTRINPADKYGYVSFLKEKDRKLPFLSRALSRVFLGKKDPREDTSFYLSYPAGGIIGFALTSSPEKNLAVLAHELAHTLLTPEIDEYIVRRGLWKKPVLSGYINRLLGNDSDFRIRLSSLSDSTRHLIAELVMDRYAITILDGMRRRGLITDEQYKKAYEHLAKALAIRLSLRGFYGDPRATVLLMDRVVPHILKPFDPKTAAKLFEDAQRALIMRYFTPDQGTGLLQSVIWPMRNEPFVQRHIEQWDRNRWVLNNPADIILPNEGEPGQIYDYDPDTYRELIKYMDSQRVRNYDYPPYIRRSWVKEDIARKEKIKERLRKLKTINREKF